MAHKFSLAEKTRWLDSVAVIDLSGVNQKKSSLPNIKDIYDLSEPHIYDADFNVALDAFADQIKDAFERDATADEIEQPIATKQARYSVATLAVAKLLKDLRQPDLAGHFHMLGEAFKDAAYGINNPFFKVETNCDKRGRRHDTSAMWGGRAELCIAVECMIVGSASHPDAVKHVVSKHRKDFANLLRPGTDLKSSLSKWLENFPDATPNDANTNEAALEAYKYGMAEIKIIKEELGNGWPSQSDVLEMGKQLVSMATARAADLPKPK